MQQEAGLGQAAKVDRLIIDWPGSGTHQEFSNVAANRGFTAFSKAIPSWSRSTANV
ncbi:MAG: ASPIC/UnbV domain-containing protein [Gammaproteobacteria bacterium]|nr:ASPIC/UnbV domain-containing protein [Gammaproteobacteria bacterium]